MYTDRGNLINTPYASRTQPVHGTLPYISHIVHIWQPFTLTQQSWMDPTTPEKKDSHPNLQHAG
jgi:hypothetical protein